jgi:hypothetical protein
MGGLEMKFKETLQKDVEEGFDNKFLDFLNTVKDREDLLATALREVTRPSGCKHYYLFF